MVVLLKRGSWLGLLRLQCSSGTAAGQGTLGSQEGRGGLCLTLVCEQRKRVLPNFLSMQQVELLVRHSKSGGSSRGSSSSNRKATTMETARSSSRGRSSRGSSSRKGRVPVALRLLQAQSDGAGPNTGD